MKRIHRFLLSGLSGILLSLFWLGLPGWFLFIAFVPLLFLDKFFLTNKKEFPVVSLWGHVFLAAIIWNVLASWWMMKVSITGVAMAMLLNSFLMSMVWWGAHSIRRKLSPGLGYIAFIVFWISYEYLQFSWDVEWPCLQLGSGLASNVKLIQWYEFTGTFGGTLWILILNVVLFQLFERLWKKTAWRNRFRYLIASVLLLVFPIGVSCFIYYSYHENEDSIRIGIVQPNVDPYTEEFDLSAETQKRNNFLKLASGVCTDSTDLLVGPETMFENQDLWNEANLKMNCFLIRLQAFLKQFEKTEMLFGVSSFKVYKSREEATYTARNRNEIIYDRFNTALLLDRYGNTQIYHKSKLVAGVEKTPYMKYISFLKNHFIDLGGTSGSLGSQKEASNLVLKDGTDIAPVICFESVFGAYVTDYVKKGAEIIVVITNDGWWKNSRGYKQHLLFSQLRAIETRRSIARSANTGTSCFINQRGEILQATRWWKEEAISGSINKNNKLSFYVKHGDYVARIAVFVSVLLGLLVLVRKFR